MRLLLVGLMAASQAEGNVNICPGPPQNWTLAEEGKEPISAHTFLPEEPLHPFF